MFVYHVTGKVLLLNMVVQRWRISLFVTYVPGWQIKIS
jgi:hypothetical protein